MESLYAWCICRITASTLMMTMSLLSFSGADVAVNSAGILSDQIVSSFSHLCVVLPST